MDRFVVFPAVVEPVMHFGWDGAFCGATPVETNVSFTDVEPCPQCIAHIPLGTKHIYRSRHGVEALCGFVREDDTPGTPGVDPYDPELCDRCWTISGGSYRVLDSGALVSLLRAGVFIPEGVPTP